MHVIALSNFTDALDRPLLKLFLYKSINLLNYSSDNSLICQLVQVDMYRCGASSICACSAPGSFVCSQQSAVK